MIYTNQVSSTATMKSIRPTAAFQLFCSLVFVIFGNYSNAQESPSPSPVPNLRPTSPAPTKFILPPSTPDPSNEGGRSDHFWTTIIVLIAALVAVLGFIGYALHRRRSRQQLRTDETDDESSSNPFGDHQENSTIPETSHNAYYQAPVDL